MALIFDLETNGLLKQLDRIHCIAILDTEKNDGAQIYSGSQIKEALQLLSDAEEIVGHNVINFDVPAIQKVCPGWKSRAKVTDTYVLSQLFHADLISEDSVKPNAAEVLPRNMWGRHSLKSWGMRMGTMKGDYDGGWEELNDDMLVYCKQDVTVTYLLYKKLIVDGANFSQHSIDTEHTMAEVCDRIGSNGWTFDIVAAGELYANLAQKRADLEREMAVLFEPWEVNTTFIPKRDNKTLGYLKGEPFVKTKVVEFNPGSRKHIHYCLTQKYGWEPDQFTANGDAKIDEAVLSTLEYPEAQKLAEMFLVQKRIASLAEGRQAWLKLCDSDGKLRHRIIPLGTVSSRASHRSPNLAQVPSTRSAYGRECRELFRAPPGWVVCGSDLSGIELRCLAHYLDDGGEYGKQILEGDIHTFNQNAAGLATRDLAKEFIYSLIYGGGDGLIGSIVGGKAKDGKRLKADFDRAIPAFKSLKSELLRAFKRGYLKGLDGRALSVRSEHRCLSQLLQSAGAIICKEWVKLIDLELTKTGSKAYIMGWIHDEVQIACPNEEVGHVTGDLARRMAKEAGIALKVSIDIDAEYSLGRTWADTH
jgi:DNA polymerase-1